MASQGWQGMGADWISAAAMVASTALVALACLIFLLAWQTRRQGKGGSLFAFDRPKLAFLFDGDRLLEVTPQARALLPGGVTSWAGAIVQLAPMFPGLAHRLTSLEAMGEALVVSGPAVSPTLMLHAEMIAGLTRLTLTEPNVAAAVDPVGSAVLAALHQEVTVQREVLLHAPVPMWREDSQGEISWANHAYLIRATELLPRHQELTWPLPRIFPAHVGGVSVSGRAKLQMPGGVEWFELTRLPQGQEFLCYAVPANATVQAETTLRDFMQTLTKTFADLPIGLAIFDRSRVLQLFNPALADLTQLAPEFLIARPNLSAVLDALRAKAMLPEPKDYRSWRRQLTKVEEEASQGIFEETWSLPGGQTYRVLGRPHPNGALAFMFEDISSEMLRTRRYRADLELGQSVIDAVDEGIAVFSQGGQLVMSNRAYVDLWQHDPAVMLSDAGIATLCAWWREQSAPSLLWEDAMEFVRSVGDRTAWEGEARLLDGRRLVCRFRPLAAGATLVAFRTQAAEQTSTRPELVPPQRLSA